MLVDSVVGCACAHDVYQEPEGGEGEEEEQDLESMAVGRCAEVLGLGSPEVSYLERRRAYIKAALVMSRTVGVSAPWSERSEMESRGAKSFVEIEQAFEGLRQSRENPPGFSPDDFLPQLQYSLDGGKTVSSGKPTISAMLHAEVRRNESSAYFFDIAVKFSTTRFVLSRSLDDFRTLHTKLKARVPACGRSLPPLPTPVEARLVVQARGAANTAKQNPAVVVPKKLGEMSPTTSKGDYLKHHQASTTNSFAAFLFGPSKVDPESERVKALKVAAVATRKLRAYLAQVIDWFRARRVYDPDVLEFLDLDADLLLRLHREDMRVVRNIVVSWGGHVAHALPLVWVEAFVQSITPSGRRSGAPPAPKHLPGPIRLRKVLDADIRTLRTTEWAVVTKPAWIILSTVYGADAELDLDSLRKLLHDKGISPALAGLDTPPTTLLGLPVAAPHSYNQRQFSV